VYAGTETSIYKITKDDDTWRPIHNGIPERYSVNCIVIDPSNTEILYAGITKYNDGGYDSEGMVIKSTDGGETWHIIRSNMKQNNKAIIVINTAVPTTIYLGIYGGVFVSKDAGNSWKQINTGLIDTSVMALAIDPLSPNTLYAGTNNGVFKATDGGGHWKMIETGIPAVDQLQAMAIAIDPKTPNIVYASVESPNGPLGIFNSIDGGENWSTYNDGIPDLAAIYEFAIDPITPTNIYAATSEGVYIH
jgi:hypothetical protein